MPWGRKTAISCATNSDPSQRIWDAGTHRTHQTGRSTTLISTSSTSGPHSFSRHNGAKGKVSFEYGCGSFLFEGAVVDLVVKQQLNCSLKIFSDPRYAASGSEYHSGREIWKQIGLQRWRACLPGFAIHGILLFRTAYIDFWILFPSMVTPTFRNQLRTKPISISPPGQVICALGEVLSPQSQLQPSRRRLANFGKLTDRPSRRRTYNHFNA